MKKTINKHYRLEPGMAELLSARVKEMNISESEYVRRLIVSDLCPMNPNVIQEVIRQVCDSMNRAADILNRREGEDARYAEYYEELKRLHQGMAKTKEQMLSLQRGAERGDT